MDIELGCRCWWTWRRQSLFFWLGRKNGDAEQRCSAWMFEQHLIICGSDFLAGVLRRRGASARLVAAYRREQVGLQGHPVLAFAEGSPFRLRQGGRQGGPGTPASWNMYLSEMLEQVLARWDTQPPRVPWAPEMAAEDTVLVWADNLYMLVGSVAVARSKTVEVEEAFARGGLQFASDSLELLANRHFTMEEEPVSTSTGLPPRTPCCWHENGRPWSTAGPCSPGFAAARFRSETEYIDGTRRSEPLYCGVQLCGGRRSGRGGGCRLLKYVTYDKSHAGGGCKQRSGPRTSDDADSEFVDCWTDWASRSWLNDTGEESMAGTDTQHAIRAGPPGGGCRGDQPDGGGSCNGCVPKALITGQTPSWTTAQVGNDIRPETGEEQRTQLSTRGTRNGTSSRSGQLSGRHQEPVGRSGAARTSESAQ